MPAVFYENLLWCSWRISGSWGHHSSELTVRGVLRVPWKARVFFNGYSTYKLNKDGLMNTHTWDRKPGEILKQFIQREGTSKKSLEYMEHPIASHLGFYLAQERQMVFPCDHYMSDSDDVYFRYRCKKHQPRFYFGGYASWRHLTADWIDNLERAFFKGQERIPSLQSQRVDPRYWNLSTWPKIHGRLQVDGIWTKSTFDDDHGCSTRIAIFGDASYVVLPITENTCRLVLKGHVHIPGTAWSWMLVPTWRLYDAKAVLTLKHLAENRCP